MIPYDVLKSIFVHSLIFGSFAGFVYWFRVHCLKTKKPKRGLNDD